MNDGHQELYNYIDAADKELRGAIRDNAMMAREDNEVLGTNLSASIHGIKDRLDALESGDGPVPNLNTLTEWVGDLATRIGAMDGAVRHLAKIIANQDAHIAALEALVGASPCKVALTSKHPSYSAAIIAPLAAAADERR